MKRNAIVFAALALILSGTMLFPAVSSAAEADTTTDPFGTNIELGEEISPTDETVTDEELYGDLDPELVQEYIEYMDYWDQLDQLDVYQGKAVDAYNNAPRLTNATRKQIFLALNNTIIPNYTKYVSGLKQIQPANPELAAIHQKIIRGSYLQLENMMLYKKAVSKTKINWTLYYQSNAKNEAGKKLMYQAKLDLYEYEGRFK
ncbi:hypothetical protein [Paenibacillus massiliensis]|uniref:hypothetical protein n=1 Tax=Paenibacillus massiliensis TaxID=225917 RepID=UPI00041F22CC|nr:hypothetical protein [Paenibacillus massiliensis]